MIFVFYVRTKLVWMVELTMFFKRWIMRLKILALLASVVLISACAQDQDISSGRVEQVLYQVLLVHPLAVGRPLG